MFRFYFTIKWGIDVIFHFPAGFTILHFFFLTNINWWCAGSERKPNVTLNLWDKRGRGREDGMMEHRSRQSNITIMIAFALITVSVDIRISISVSINSFSLGKFSIRIQVLITTIKPNLVKELSDFSTSVLTLTFMRVVVFEDELPITFRLCTKRQSLVSFFSPPMKSTTSRGTFSAVEVLLLYTDYTN